jgi:hypothetical protein
MNTEGIYKLPVDYKIDDIDIFACKGVSLPYSIPVVIRQLKCFNWFYIYLPMMSKMVEYFYKILPDITLLKDFKDIDNINNFKDRFLTSLQDVAFRSYCIKMFKKLGFIKCDEKTLFKNIYINELCEMFLLTYLFNTEGLKKKLKFLIERVYTLKNQMSETSYSNAKNMGGSKMVNKIERPKKIKKSLNL